MSGSSVRRASLWALAVGAGVVGTWASVAPESFYDDFVFGRAWIRLDGAYNEHLIRDVGALNLALAVMTAAAALRLGRPLVRIAAGSTLVFAVPHLAYHAGAMEPFAPADIIAQSVVLAIQVVVPAVLFMFPGDAEPDVDSPDTRSHPARSEGPVDTTT